MMVLPSNSGSPITTCPFLDECMVPLPFVAASSIAIVFVSGEIAGVASQFLNEQESASIYGTVSAAQYTTNRTSTNVLSEAMIDVTWLTEAPANSFRPL